jgi:phage gpG-like protein
MFHNAGGQSSVSTGNRDGAAMSAQEFMTLVSATLEQAMKDYSRVPLEMRRSHNWEGGS